MKTEIETRSGGEFIVHHIQRRSRGELFLATVVGAFLGSILMFIVMAYL